MARSACRKLERQVVPIWVALTGGDGAIEATIQPIVMDLGVHSRRGMQKLEYVLAVKAQKLSPNNLMEDMRFPGCTCCIKSLSGVQSEGTPCAPQYRSTEAPKYIYKPEAGSHAGNLLKCNRMKHVGSRKQEMKMTQAPISTFWKER